ncbi:MAG: DUF2828 family protein [Erysipelotrichaceae bacterium]|nr:DUF2828 family protein [Erysipelotrichaceae bacterium]
MNILDMIKKEQNYTLTENGALALNSTENALVDLFAVSGAMRGRDEKEIEVLFQRALAEDKQTATRLAFYTRDVRGGLGERRTGRIFFRYMAKHYPQILKKNIRLISEYGRWDDLVDLLGILPQDVLPLIREQLEEDLANMKIGLPVSLLAKWLPSVNTSSKETVRRGRMLAAGLQMSERGYRKTLAQLRRYLNVTEVDLSARSYEKILYPQVPSKAMNNYRNAFLRNDEERFREYLDKVSSGEEKINASVLYPYDIVEKILYGGVEDDPVLEAQWKALPNYVEDEKRCLIMADVSGSMGGRPMATSIGLAIYFAERNKGPFAGRFMTFSARPELVEIKGENLAEKIRYVENAEWNMNTDLEAAFDLVLRTAVRNKVKQEELPESIVVITDMEFDQCVSGNDLFYDTMKAKYEAFGYQIPNIVFWNVRSGKNTYHASFDRPGVQLASGQSPVVFESLAKGVNMTPQEYMLSVLNSERYEPITA